MNNNMSYCAACVYFKSFILTGNFATGWNANISSGHTYNLSLYPFHVLVYYLKDETIPLQKFNLSVNPV